MKSRNARIVFVMPLIIYTPQRTFVLSLHNLYHIYRTYSKGKSLLFLNSYRSYLTPNSYIVFKAIPTFFSIKFIFFDDI